MAPKVSSTVFITLSSSLVVLIVIFPWILGVISIFGLLGYFYLEVVNENVKQFLQDNQIFLFKNDEVVELESDPLLNIKPISTVGLQSSSSSPSPTCSVCSIDSCTRDGESGHQHNSGHQHGSRKQTPSPKHSPTPPPVPITNYIPGMSANDLKIDLRLDAALSRFCTTVFDFYISRHWAPHETRKQLKLAFKKLLTNFAERVKSRLILVNEKGEQSVEKFCREKLIPLFLYHLQETTKASNRAINLCELERKQARTKLKVRRLCRQVLEKCLSPEDLHCKLWMELCVAVLSDGVLWNLIKLGKEEIPDLVETALQNLNKSYGSQQTSSMSGVSPDSENTLTEEEPFSKISTPRLRIPSEGEDTVDSVTYNDHLQSHSTEETSQSRSQNNQDQSANAKTNGKENRKEVPFLLDSYLDPVNDIDQPDDIASRWRPKLHDILEERELLYCLIQYLKGHKALEYLQAVLDDSADAKDYCKKILELEYLPCFCRCSPFLEKMGLSRVDAGIEPVTETNSNGSSRPNSGHTRSASFGGGNSGLQILKFEQGVVDGLPLYQTPSAAPSISSGLSSGFILPGAGTMEPDFVFKKKPTTTLESTISKFFSSTLSPPRHVVDVLCDRPDAAKRAGVDSKTYDDYSHPEVNMTVFIKQCDILEASTEAVTSSISLNPWVGPILSGWLQLLHPYIKPRFDSFLEQKLNDFLTIELFVEVVDLISDTFLQKNVAEEAESKLEASSDAELPHEINTNENSWISQFEKYLVTHVLDLEFFAKSLGRNKDNITAFFVDVLDVFVNEIS